MANANPIKINIDPSETPYVIAAEHSDRQISISVLVDLSADGWKHDDSVTVTLNGVNKYPAMSPAPTDLVLGTAAQLHGKLLVVLSKISAIKPAGGATQVPKYKYKLIFKADGTVIDTFEADSSSKNPTHFNSLSKIV